MQGTIVKGIAGFYYVLAQDKIYECKARGKFRNSKITPLVGDHVEVFEDTNSVASDKAYIAGTIEKILPRLNEFDRPPIANVDLVVIVSATKDPMPLTYIIDRMAVSCEEKNTNIAICINKSDLANVNEITDAYKDVYPVFVVSAKNGDGIEDLKAFLKGKQVALSGPSGVGKSSLTNALINVNAQVGSISEKTLRGKNTTRHSELFKGDGFYLFDTPGFTSFDTPEIELLDLDGYFPEFAKLKGQCRFSDCTHQNEPDCAIKEALEKGDIKKSRYESFVSMYKEIKERKKF